MVLLLIGSACHLDALPRLDVHVGIACMVNKHVPQAHQQAMFDFFASYVAPEASMDLVIRSVIGGPFRTSHFDTRAPALAKWEAFGYDVPSVEEYLNVSYTMMVSPNLAEDLSLPSVTQYL
eukprot:320552-Chlamydomonas_euryale.AAC.14